MTTTAADVDGSVAEELRALLARRRISGRQLAALLGWAPQYLSRRMTGQIPFTVGDLFLISQALDVKVTDLLPANTGSTWTSLLQGAAA